VFLLTANPSPVYSFVVFNHYRIPRENLLNRTGDVTPEGKYKSPYRDPSKRHGASLGALSTGRVAIVGMGVINLGMALTIAIRYSAVRRQFGPSPDVEVPVIEYQLQQWRLFPYLAAEFALLHFIYTFFTDFVTFSAAMVMGEQSERQVCVPLHYGNTLVSPCTVISSNL